MTIEAFLKRFVDGYLLHDLESMANITLPAGQEDGAVGYPMVSTTLAGIELLGGLISKDKETFDPFKGGLYFSDYWDRCLVKVNKHYLGLGRLFKQLIRNGLAHNFITKPRILVVKSSNPSIVGESISYDLGRGALVVDCVGFYKDFEKSYRTYIRPIVFDSEAWEIADKLAMQQRLDKMIERYSKESDKEFNDCVTNTLGRMSITGFETKSGGASGYNPTASGIENIIPLTTSGL